MSGCALIHMDGGKAGGISECLCVIDDVIDSLSCKPRPSVCKMVLSGDR